MDWNIDCEKSVLNSDKRGIEVIWDYGEKSEVDFEDIVSVKTEETTQVSEGYKNAYVYGVICAVSIISSAYAYIVASLPSVFLGGVAVFSAFFLVMAAYEIYNEESYDTDIVALTINYSQNSSLVLRRDGGFPDSFITMVSGRADDGLIND